MAAAKTDEDREIARDARRFKRDIGNVYLLLLAVAVFGLVVGPVINRYIGAWQGVVVAPPEGSKVRVMLPTSQVVRQPVPKDLAGSLKVGDYLRKRSMTWGFRRIPQSALTDDPDIDDPAKQPPRALPAYFARYMSTWAGTVVEVTTRRLPTHGGGGILGKERSTETTMVIALDGGARRTMTVPDKLVSRVRRGTRLEKSTRSWGPVIAGQGAPIPPAPADGGTADGGTADGGR